MPVSVQTAYRDRLASGEIAPDAAQASAVSALSQLEGELNALAEPGFARLLHRKREPPRGVYLYGPVGRGKSMVMDLFFDSAPVAAKRRVHFHAFMGEVHGLIDAWRKGDAAARKARFGQAKGDDPIPPVAHHLAEGARLLCFDEFHVTDIADAMILGRLFEALWTSGVVIVATSNRAPDALYQDGLNRQLFLPFIERLKARMTVVRVDGPKDFRLDRLKGQQVYFSPVSEQTCKAFEALWTSLLDGTAETGDTLEVMGRKLRLPHTAGGHLKASFVSLCGVALGRAGLSRPGAPFPHGLPGRRAQARAGIAQRGRAVRLADRRPVRGEKQAGGAGRGGAGRALPRRRRRVRVRAHRLAPAGDALGRLCRGRTRLRPTRPARAWLPSGGS